VGEKSELIRLDLFLNRLIAYPAQIWDPLICHNFTVGARGDRCLYREADRWLSELTEDLNLLERGLTESRTTVIVPFD
jgi:hypothetical protein